MRKSFFIIICFVLLVGCAPPDKTPISRESLVAIQSVNAIEDWRKTMDETDECSSTCYLHWVAESFLDKNWYDCCYQHDFDYREGSKYGITKTQADYELWQCVYDSGHPHVARIIYTAVDLLGGSSWQEHERLEGIREQ